MASAKSALEVAGPSCGHRQMEHTSVLGLRFSTRPRTPGTRRPRPTGLWGQHVLQASSVGDGPVAEQDELEALEALCFLKTSKLSAEATASPPHASAAPRPASKRQQQQQHNQKQQQRRRQQQQKSTATRKSPATRASPPSDTSSGATQCGALAAQDFGHLPMPVEDIHPAALPGPMFEQLQLQLAAKQQQQQQAGSGTPESSDTRQVLSSLTTMPSDDCAAQSRQFSPSSQAVPSSPESGAAADAACLAASLPQLQPAQLQTPDDEAQQRLAAISYRPPVKGCFWHVYIAKRIHEDQQKQQQKPQQPQPQLQQQQQKEKARLPPQQQQQAAVGAPHKRPQQQQGVRAAKGEAAAPKRRRIEQRPEPPGSSTAAAAVGGSVVARALQQQQVLLQALLHQQQRHVPAVVGGVPALLAQAAASAAAAGHGVLPPAPPAAAVLPPAQLLSSLNNPLVASAAAAANPQLLQALAGSLPAAARAWGLGPAVGAAAPAVASATGLLAHGTAAPGIGIMQLQTLLGQLGRPAGDGGLLQQLLRGGGPQAAPIPAAPWGALLGQTTPAVVPFLQTGKIAV